MVEKNHFDEIRRTNPIVAVSVPKETRAILDEKAKALGMTRAGYARHLILTGLGK